jgi:hypothetical protein
MSEAIKEIVEETKPIDAEIGDVITEDGELLIVEADEESKSTKEAEVELDDDGNPIEAEVIEPSKSKEEVVVAPEIPETTKTELLFLKKQVEEQNRIISEYNLSPEELLKRTTLTELTTDIEKQRELLNDIDQDLSPREYVIQKKVVDQLNTAIEQKMQSERIDERFNAQDNKDFLLKERKELEDSGFKYSDDNWKLIDKMASKYLDGGKYTKDAIQKGLIDILGSEAVGKMYKVSSEQKLRMDLKVAATKVTKAVNITSTGVAGKLSSFTARIAKMTDQGQIERALAKLTAEQLAIYEKYLEKQTL